MEEGTLKTEGLLDSSSKSSSETEQTKTEIQLSESSSKELLRASYISSNETVKETTHVLLRDSKKLTAHNEQLLDTIYKGSSRTQISKSKINLYDNSQFTIIMTIVVSNVVNMTTSSRVLLRSSKEDVIDSVPTKDFTVSKQYTNNKLSDITISLEETKSIKITHSKLLNTTVEVFERNNIHIRPSLLNNFELVDLEDNKKIETNIWQQQSILSVNIKESLFYALRFIRGNLFVVNIRETDSFIIRPSLLDQFEIINLVDFKSIRSDNNYIQKKEYINIFSTSVFSRKISTKVRLTIHLKETNTFLFRPSLLSKYFIVKMTDIFFSRDNIGIIEIRKVVHLKESSVSCLYLTIQGGRRTILIGETNRFNYRPSRWVIKEKINHKDLGYFQNFYKPDKDIETIITKISGSESYHHQIRWYTRIFERICYQIVSSIPGYHYRLQTKIKLYIHETNIFIIT